MKRISLIILTALATFLMGFTAYVLLPGLQIKSVEAAEASAPYTYTQSLGKSLYISEGCVSCHTQQVRPSFYGSDAERSWGSRNSEPADYLYDTPALLGSQRIGPDLHDAGSRLTDQDAILAHLYQPRVAQPNSNMPSYAYLFEVRPIATVLPSETVITVDESVAPAEGEVIVATEEALALSVYLMSLKLD